MLNINNEILLYIHRNHEGSEGTPKMNIFKAEPCLFTRNINGHTVISEVDTGAGVSVMSIETFMAIKEN